MSKDQPDLTAEQFDTVLKLAGLSIPAEMQPQVLAVANSLRQAALKMRTDRPVTAEPAHVFSSTEIK